MAKSSGKHPACRCNDLEIVASWKSEWCALLRCRACGAYFIEMAHMHYAWPPAEISDISAQRLMRADAHARHHAISALEPGGGGPLRVADFEHYLLITDPLS